MRALSTIVFSVLVAQLANAAGPISPDQIPGLQVWLTDAATNYNPSTGVWTDISGNGNDASPFGTAASTGITYVAPTLNASATTIDTNNSAAVFNGNVDDLLAIPGLNGGAGLGELTIVTVYSAPNVAINGAVRPAGFGSLAATPAVGDVFNVATDSSIRFDNGKVVATATHPTASFVRISGMSLAGDSIMEWWDSGSGLELTLADTGNAFTTATDTFYLGDLRVGATGLPSNTPALNTLDDTFEVSQILVYDSKLTQSEAAAVNFYVQNVPEPASASLLLFGLGFMMLVRRRIQPGK